MRLQSSSYRMPITAAQNSESNPSMLLDVTRFPLLVWLASCAETIRTEALGIPFEKGVLFPYLEAYTGEWRCFPLIASEDYQAIGLTADLAPHYAPHSVELLQTRPEIVAVGVSMLPPGTHILPHVDDRREGIIRAHLGLEIPAGSAIRVGPNLEHWHEGEVLVFDGRIDHEAVNTGGVRRVVLLVDFRLSEAEQAYLDETNANIDSRWFTAGAGAGLFTGAEL